jgi:OmpA-OmpF porin, OOP family
MIRHLTVCALVALAPALVAANELALPDGSRPLIDRDSALDSYALPVAPFKAGEVPVRSFEGRVRRQTWRIDGSTATTLQLLVPLRDQIVAEGYDLVLDCKDKLCGGFDFRFQTEVAPAPGMYVDIRDYRFVAGIRDNTEAVGLLVSRSRTAAYIQIIRATRTYTGLAAAPSTQKPVDPADPLSLRDGLMANGHVALADLNFESGAAVLGKGPFASLAQLKRFLTDKPGYRIALVGHTDNAGPLPENISLSRRRAAAVRQRLIADYGIAPDRIEAEGMGYLAPVASNLTAAGREANRRVEVILLPDY